MFVSGLARDTNVHIEDDIEPVGIIRGKSWQQTLTSYKLPPMPPKVQPALEQKDFTLFLPNTRNRALVVDTIVTNLLQKKVT